MKKFLTILLIIMFFSSLNLVCASEFNSTSLESVQEEESIITPNTEKLSANEESGKFTSENEGSFSELRSLIYNTPNNGVLNLNKSYSFSNTDYDDFIVISKSITINGNNNILNGKNSQGIFEIRTGSVFLNNIVFSNNDNTKSTIYVTSGYCQINNSTFTDNYARQALIYGSKGVCDVVNSTFSDNDAGWGIVYYYPIGGNITNCLFRNNLETCAYYAGNGRIYNTTFINNSDNAVYLSTNNNLDVINCYFLNHVITKGSLFYISSGNVLLYNSTFKNNQMKNQYLVYSYNGGIIDSCIFENNSAVRGGAIYSNGYQDTIQICNSIFRNNVASTYGGAIYVAYDGLIIKNNTMEGNKAQSGNDIYYEVSDYYTYKVSNFYLTISNNSTIYSNEMVEIIATLTDDMGNTVSGPEITLQINGEDKFTKTFVNGEASFYVSPLKKGANTLSGYLLYLQDDIIVKNATLVSTIDQYVGPIYVSLNGNDSNKGDKNNPLKSIQKAVDLAATSSQKVIITEGVYYQHDINVTLNSVEITGEGNVVIDANGLGRAFIVTKNFTLSNVKIINTKSVSDYQYTTSDFNNYFSSENCYYNLNRQGFGGAIFVPISANVVVENVTFENNEANFGGAIFSLGYRWGYSFNNVSVINCEFINNIAHQNGGAIYSNYQTNIQNSKFLNNRALKALTSQGGAIYGLSLNVTDSHFEDNNATFGGSIYSSSLYIQNSKIINSKAVYGGAIYTSQLSTFNNSISNSFGVQDKGLFVTEQVSTAVIVILDNRTIQTNLNYYDVYAKITDDAGNPISGNQIFFFVNDEQVSYDSIVNGSASLRISLNNGTNTISARLTYLDYYYDIYARLYYVQTYNATIVSNSLSYNGPFYVSVDGDDSAIGDADNPLKSLKLAVDLATREGGSNVVIMKEGTYYIHNFDLSKSVEIIGEGKVIIDAEGKGRIFKLDSINTYGWYSFYSIFKLSNLILMNGNATKVNSLERTYFDNVFDIYNIFQINQDLGYGGAIYTTAPLILENITFVNNYANLGGAIFAKEIQASDIKFINNSALEYDNGVYIGAEAIDEGFEQLEIIYFSNYASDNFWVTNSIPFAYGNYTVFSTQELSDFISFGYVTRNLNFFKNNFNNEDVIEYLKILMINHRNETLELQKAIWIFTDGKYWESSHPWIVETIKQYNEGNLIPDYGIVTLNDGTVVEYDFKGVYSPRDDFFYYVNPDKDVLRVYHNPENNEQSDFLMLTYFDTYNNITVDKYTLNESVMENQIVEFLITVVNGGNNSLSGVLIEDSDFSQYLEFVGWVSQNGTWTFDKSNMKWYLDHDLQPGESVSIIVKFKALHAGELRNNVTAGFNNKTIVDSFNTTEVLHNHTHNDTLGNGSRNDSEIIVDNPDVPGEPDIPENPTTPDNPTNPPSQPKKPKSPKSVSHSSGNSHATGNPIMVFLLVLLSLVLIRRKD